MFNDRRKFIKTAGTGLLASLAIPSFANELISESVIYPSDISFEEDEEKYWKQIRQMFPLSKEKIYLNNGTMGPSPYPVIDTVHKYMRDADENGTYGGWEKTAEKLAEFVGASAEEIALTHNVTEGINIICWGMPLKKGDEVIMTSHEHVGGAAPWLNRAKLHGIVIKTFTPAATAAETLQRINDLINKKTRALAIPHIPCTQGQVMPAKEMCKLARDKGIFSFIDGAHGPGMLHINLHDMGCDFYASCSHKWMLGPKGTGFLYVRKELLDTMQTYSVGGSGLQDWNMNVTPLLFKGYAPDAKRYYYGTQNLALYKGVESAIDFINAIGLDRINKRILGFGKYFQDELLKLEGKIDMLTPTEDISRGSVIGFRVKSTPFGKVSEIAGENKIRIRGVAENGLNSNRASFHIYNNKSEIDKLVEVIKNIA
jgi:L-cysteine/cystine lyase